MTFERADNAKRTENIELQKAAAEVELSQLKQRVHEQEALLVERQSEMKGLEGDLKTQQRTIDDLLFQKSQLEHDIHQYRTKLETVVVGKTASEQELIHTKQLVEQSEAALTSAQKKLEDLVNKQTNDEEEVVKQRPKLQTKLEVGEDTEEKLQSQVQINESDQQLSDSQLQSSAVTESNNVTADVLQQNLEELVRVQERAEMAEEKAESYKKLLDDSDNRLKKFQVDLETERNHMRQTSEDLQRETLNMTKSIDELQEEIRALQRAKSSLEQNAFFNNTEVEGLKEHLKITQAELHKKSSMDQDQIHKISDLEEEVACKQAVIDQLNYKCAELTGMNVSSENDIRGLQIHAEALEKERSSSEQKIKALKSEIQSWKLQLQTVKEENTLMKRSEQASQLKCKNVEDEIQNIELVASQLQKKVDELKEINIKTEENLTNVRAELNQAMMEMDRKDQQIRIFKSQMDGNKSQVGIIEEELNKKSQIFHELQIKLQDYSEEVKKMAELQQTNKTLKSNIGNYATEIKTLKSDLKSASAEKNLAQQKVHVQNAEISDLNVVLKNKNVEHLDKVKALGDDLFRCKENIKELTSNSEKVAGGLQQEIQALQSDKREAEKNVENLNVKLSELSSSLQKVKDELTKETKERKFKESIIMQLEIDIQKNKVTMKEVMSSSDKSRSNLQHENTILKGEKAAALEKNIPMGSEIRVLKEKLQRTETEAERKQKENSVLKLTSRQMEEQLENCKKMLEELKAKLELQKEAYERQLLLVQNENENKEMKNLSRMKTENRRANKQEVSESSHHYGKHHEAALLKTDVAVMQKSVPSYENAKSSMEDETVKVKGSSEVWMKSVQHK